jgi:hypothetical protein
VLRIEPRPQPSTAAADRSSAPACRAPRPWLVRRGALRASDTESGTGRARGEAPRGDLRCGVAARRRSSCTGYGMTDQALVDALLRAHRPTSWGRPASVPVPPSDDVPVPDELGVPLVPLVPLVPPVDPLVPVPDVPGEPDRLPCRSAPVEPPVPVSDGLPVPAPEVPEVPVSPDVPVPPAPPGPPVAPLFVPPDVPPLVVPPGVPPDVPPGAPPAVPPDVSLCSVGIGLGCWPWFLLRSRSFRHALPIVAATTNAERKIQRVIRSSCTTRRARAMRGTPGPMFDIAAIPWGSFPRAAATARAGAPWRAAVARRRSICSCGRVLRCSMANRRNSMQIVELCDVDAQGAVDEPDRSR